MSADERFALLGLELPPVTEPAGLYMPAIVTSGLCHLSGHLHPWHSQRPVVA